MEMLISFGGERHEFCPVDILLTVVIKLKHVRSCPSFDFTYS